mgnify:CR=1 FL=1
MKIFITGVAGFLGSHLADKLLDLGHAVHGNDNFLGGFRRNINHRVVFTETNCLSTDELALYMEGCASVSTMSAAIQAKVKRFVFCSSMARYGEGVAPFVETHATAPVDPYGIAKVAAEETLKVLCKVHGMEYNIAIPHNIVGPRQRFDDPFRNVLSIMANRNLRGLPSYVYGDGSQQRCFSYIDDCISCLEKMVIDPTIINETINIGPDENPITINEAAKLVAEECYYDGDSVRYPGRPQEVKFATCSSDKARSLLGYETTTSIEDAIKYTVEYIRQVNPRPFDYGFPLEIQNDKTPEVWKDRLL